MLLKFNGLVLACCAFLIFLIFIWGVAHTGAHIHRLRKKYGAPPLWYLLALLSWVGCGKFSRWLEKALHDRPIARKEPIPSEQLPQFLSVWMLVKTEWAFRNPAESGLQQYWLEPAKTYAFAVRDWKIGEHELIPISASYRQRKQWAALRFDREIEGWKIEDVKYPIVVVARKNELVTVYGPAHEAMEAPQLLLPGDTLIVHNTEFLLARLPDLYVVSGDRLEEEPFKLIFGQNSYCLINQAGTGWWCYEADYEKADWLAWPYALKINAVYEVGLVPGRWPSRIRPQLRLLPTSQIDPMPHLWRAVPGAILSVSGHAFRFTACADSR